MKRSIVLAVGAGAVALAACQVIAGIDRVDKVQAAGEGTSGGSGEGGSTSGAIPANDSCKHMLPPPPPEKSDPGEDLPQFYMAATKLSLTEKADNGVGGYDLDETCTCSGLTPTAHDGGASCTARNKMVLCDGDGGVDNQGAILFKTFQDTAGQNLDTQFNDGAAQGIRTIMIYILGWNGQKNDLDIQTSLFVSNGDLNATGDSSYRSDLDGGTAVWSYPSTAHKKDDFIVPAATSTGYVSNGVLVVSKAGTVDVLFGNTGLSFNDAIIIGDLRRDPVSGIASFQGVVGGRIQDSALLSAAGQVKVSGTIPACNYEKAGINLFDLAIKPQICNATDISHAALTDFKDTTCDAISSAIALTALSAHVGGDTYKDPVTDTEPNPCAPSKVDPARYKCN